MKQFIALIIALLFTAIIGCDGDSDSSEVPPPAPGYVPGTGTEDDGDEDIRVWENLLDTGGNVTPGTHFIGGAALSDRSGTLRCVYTWSAPPTNLTCWLKQYDGSGESVHIYGPSPLTVTTHVDGGGWSPYIHNAYTMPVYVSVSVDFLPD